MIIYFSGTGNSLRVAQQIADETEDSALPIHDVKQAELMQSKRIGLVFPIYSYDIPVLMQNFIKAFDFPPSAYVYGIATHGGDKGNALLNLSKILKEKAIDLAYSNDLLMPVSSRIMYGMVTDKIEERTTKAKEKISLIATDIKNEKQHRGTRRKKALPAIINKLMETDYMKGRFTPHIDTELCTNCGICSSVCPSFNITEQAGKAYIGNNCVQCMTCMHWCPQVAIHYKNTRVKAKQQYHHPEVKLKDLTIKN